MSKRQKICFKVVKFSNKKKIGIQIDHFFKKQLALP